MKAFKNLLATILVLTFTLSAYAALVVPAVPATVFPSEHKGKLVKATLVNGEWIAMVDLPEVEIVGFRNTPNVHKAVLHDGEVIAEVELPSVEITGERIHSAAELASGEKNYERIYDLPVIEIESTFPVEKLSKAGNTDNQIQAIIELEEVVITYTKSDDLQAIEPNSFSISTDAGNKYLIAGAVNQEILNALTMDLQGEKEYKYYSIAVDNCIITEKRQKICELVIKMSNNAIDGLKENLINVITQ